MAASDEPALSESALLSAVRYDRWRLALNSFDVGLPALSEPSGLVFAKNSPVA